MTRFKVEAMLRNKKEKAYVSSVYLDMKPPWSVEVGGKPYSAGNIMPKFQMFDACRGNTRAHVTCFLDSMGGYALDLTFT